MKKILLLIAAAAIGLSAATSAQTAGATFKLCTGNSQLNYFKAGHMLKAEPVPVV